jgi:hypothetical protein
MLLVVRNGVMIGVSIADATNPSTRLKRAVDPVNTV